jgi:hypothetical protein
MGWAALHERGSQESDPALWFIFKGLVTGFRLDLSPSVHACEVEPEATLQRHSPLEHAPRLRSKLSITTAQRISIDKGRRLPKGPDSHLPTHSGQCM